jgi:hypothetical protein
MNVLRSLARSLFASPADGGLATRAQRPNPGRVPSVVDVERYRDSFEQIPQKATALSTLRGERSFLTALQSAAGTRDGFDGVKRAPVDLSGGRKPVAIAPMVAPAAKPVPQSNGFSASLDDFA